MSKKIVLIEDDDILSGLLQRRLAQQGYEVFLTKDGKAGLSAIRTGRPDLILLDIIMPRMGGFEVMEEIQKDPKLKKIPIIIVSNSGQPVELDRAQKLGARDWLVKTDFDPQEVIEKVKKQIGS